MMNKRITALFLAVLMFISLLSGCGYKEVEEPEATFEPGNEVIDETEGEITVNIDSYIQIGGMLNVTTEDGEVHETGAWSFAASEGEKLGDVLKRGGVVNVEPILEGDTFEGWMVFKDIVTTDSDGLMNFTFELASGDTIYTTQELMELTVPSHDVTYIVKWASLSIEEYFAEEDYMYSEDTTGAVILNANGGNMKFSMEGSDEIDSPIYVYWLEDGESVNAIAADSEMWHTFVIAEKDGAELVDWNVYAGDSVEWSSEKSTEEGVTSLDYDNRYEGFEYINITNCTTYNSNMSTEDLFELVNDGKCYVAIANWR